MPCVQACARSLQWKHNQPLSFTGRMIPWWPFLSGAHDRLGLYGERMLVVKYFHSSTLIIPLQYHALSQGPSKESRLSSFPAETEPRPPNKPHLLKFSLPPCPAEARLCSFALSGSGRAAAAHLWCCQPVSPHQTLPHVCWGLAKAVSL